MATILLVEDEPAQRHLLKLVLERKGFSVLAAGDAAEALALFENSGPVDLLVSDVAMPGMSGPELAVCLAARNPRLPVLFISGFADQDSMEQAVRSIEFSFLRKPFPPTTFITTVTKLLRTRAA